MGPGYRPGPPAIPEARARPEREAEAARDDERFQ